MQKDIDHLRAYTKFLDREQSKMKPAKYEFHEQPFDRLLLTTSPLYRKSRQHYLGLAGAQAFPTFQSAPRALSSDKLLSPVIHYSPIESEYIWVARAENRFQKKRENDDALVSLRNCVTNVFHEQNHRLLWHYLPPAPAKSAELRRYLNFAESLVIAMDMAQADELGPWMAEKLHRVGVAYDLGSTLRQEGLSRRHYRNYLHAAQDATYLLLELYEPKKIIQALKWIYPMMEMFAERAARRAITLDHAFVTNTNLMWQRKHSRIIHKTLGGKAPLVLARDPFDNRQQYLFCEKWLDLWKL